MHQAAPGLYQPTTKEVQKAFNSHTSLVHKAASVYLDPNQEFWPGCFLINDFNSFQFRVIPSGVNEKGDLVCLLVPRFKIEDSFELTLIIPADA